MTESATCPCCGQDVKIVSKPLWVDVDAREIIYAGERRHITPSIAMIAEAILDRYPSAASQTFLTDKLWGGDPNGGPENAPNVVSVQIFHLRKAIKGWPVTIECLYGSYRFVLEDHDGQS